MRRTPQKAPRKVESHHKPIKEYADYQKPWASVIPTLRKFQLKKITFLSVMGDAPKDFTTDSEYREGYRSHRDREERFIAKVGSKYYPNESITEHLITRIGQHFRVKIANSKLRIIDGQVRFMSKYFLRMHTEQLTHGAEIFESCLGKQEYSELVEKKMESEYFSFQMACEAIRHAFPEQEFRIISGLIETLAFDALIGHNDRHPYNWGVIVPVNKNRSPRFAPVYDTARALFWNKSETYIERVLTDKRPLLDGYINKCAAPLGWDGKQKIDFFRLIGLIWSRYKNYRHNIEKFLTNVPLKKSIQCVDKEFGLLMSQNRRELIKRCLQRRQELLGESVQKFKEEEKQNAS